MDWAKLLKSKTLWGIVVTAGALLLGKFGDDQAAANLEGEKASVMVIVEQVAIVVGLVLAAYGRVVAKGPISNPTP